jgi:hypothetical protein
VLTTVAGLSSGESREIGSAVEPSVTLHRPQQSALAVRITVPAC